MYSHENTYAAYSLVDVSDTFIGKDEELTFPTGLRVFSQDLRWVGFRAGESGLWRGPSVTKLLVQTEWQKRNIWSKRMQEEVLLLLYHSEVKFGFFFSLFFWGGGSIILTHQDFNM